VVVDSQYLSPAEVCLTALVHAEDTVNSPGVCVNRKVIHLITEN